MRLVFLLAVLPAAALAEPPEVNVDALCRDVAWTGEYVSATILSECRRWEAEARAEVAPGWDALPFRLRWHCGRLASANRTGSYKALAICVRAGGMPGPGAPHSFP
ncbi:MAG: hypothetical protein AB1918_02850 [Pseudomonadota bacterium]